MPYYRVLLLGSNFLLDADGEVGKYGFYTTRFVEAFDEDQAADLAIELLWEERDLDTLGDNEPDDPPRLRVDEIDEVESLDGLDNLAPGLAFFAETGDQPEG